MKPRRAPIVRYPVALAVEEIRKGSLTLSRQIGGHAELLGGSQSLGVHDHIYAIGWLSASQVEQVEAELQAAP